MACREIRDTASKVLQIPIDKWQETIRIHVGSGQKAVLRKCQGVDSVWVHKGLHIYQNFRQ
jgi:hypothetical protein